MTRALGRVLLASILLGAAGPHLLSAQGVRGWAQTSVRYFELRPIVADTASADQLVVGADGVVRVDGRAVACEPGQRCVFFRPAAVRSAWVGSQDVGFTAWGFGVEGLSLTGLARARDHLSGDLAWPLADDPFDLMVGYAQLQRGQLRARVGRQETPSGLGFSGFDGGSVRWNERTWWVEGFGGRSLARGLSETRREALRGIEDFVPDQEAYLWGGAAGVRLGATDLAGRYQREIIGDRSGLVSERAALDLSTVLPWALRMRASVDYDVPFDRWGKAHLTLQRALVDGRLLAEVEARRYVPYFELSTVWGFFSPVPYHEGRVRLSAGLGRETGVQLSLAARSYGDPSTTSIFRPLEDDGWQAEAAGFWAPLPTLRLDASYQVDWGASAYLSALDAGVRWEAASGLALRATGTTFQQFEAFRLGDGRAVGGGLGVEWDLLRDVRLDGGFLALRQDAGRDAPDDVWNQVRAWFGLRYAFGDDPGLRGRTR
jgi:hypothetical protein